MLAWMILLAQMPTAPLPTAPLPTAPLPCAQALLAVPNAQACAASKFGVALADTQAEADRLIADAVTGEARFADVFARNPSRYAIFSFADPASIATTRAALGARGIKAVLTVPSAGFLARQRERALAAAGGPVAGGRMVIRKPMAASDEPRDPDDHELIPHELGHLWYAEVFWAATPRSAADRYGSAAPDWLDEVAAMLMESPLRAEVHRNRFSDGRGADEDRAATIPPEIPLSQLVTMPHPATAGLLAAGTASGPIRVTSAPSLFYAEARVFADYLIERSGDPHILAAVSDNMSKGATFADWLARHGAGHRLPSTLTAMDQDWQQWLARRYGPPA